MAEITAKLVKELREKSGAGVMDAKKALVETDGDIEKAIELLREKGMAKAAKKADRVAAEGLTGVYVNGNVAAVVEVNAETDFVAKNAQFVELVNATAKVIAEGKPANNEEALALTMPSGETLEAAYVSATATIGEKISFRRFALIEKTDAQHFGAYQHNGGRIGVISVIEGGDEALAKQISMHIAAMKPTVLSYKELDEQFVKDELAQLNHVIDQDNESRAMVNKPALPHLAYGSKAQLTDEVIAQAEEAIKAELAAEGLTGVYVNGNVAAVIEVNAETDFVAKNAQFVELVNTTAKVIAEGKPANNEEALALTMPSGETLEAAYVSATATIGEKISFRRFALIEKTDAQHFGAYQHNGGRIGVISVVEGGDEALAKQLSMHIAAMKPTVLSYKELDEQFVKDELAQLNHVIDQDNESRAMVNKPALPHLKYGSKAQLTDEVIAQAEEAIKAELAAEGKPEKIWDKIIPGKMDRFMLDNTKVDQAYTLLAQVYIMDDSKTVEAYLESVNASVVEFARFEVGEGIEKAANDFEAEVAATMAAALNN